MCAHTEFVISRAALYANASVFKQSMAQGLEVSYEGGSRCRLVIRCTDDSIGVLSAL